ncbi:MAG: hypothetical protein F6J87_24445 [Spirulina sp. SIO3F2]|nr:hypothetical protein [Spirulina sp. SIO3F2]
MTLAELLPNIQALSDQEKRQLIQILAADLSNDETSSADTKAAVLADLEQSLRDVQAGQLFALETLWDGIGL